MYQLKLEQMPVDEATLRAALTQYKADLDAHVLTEGVPAPWPQYEILREIVAAGGDFAPLTERDLALQALRSKMQQDAIKMEDVMLVLESRKLNALKAVKDFVAANPALVAEVDVLLSN